MKATDLKKALHEDVTLIGHKTYGDSDEGLEIFEELYVTESGSYYLIGSYGINDGFLEGGELTAWCLPNNRGYVRLSREDAKYWAARFLTQEEYEKAFGRCTRMEKILNNLKAADICELMSDALECRAHELSKEEFAESEGLNAKNAYPGFSDIGMYELAERMWDLCDPVSAYPEEAEKEKETETAQVLG